MRNQGSKHVGIMVCEMAGTIPFRNERFMRLLCKAGKPHGLLVFVFSPLSVDWNRETVIGYTYNEKSASWIRNTYPLPKVVYDRCFYSSKPVSVKYRAQIDKLRRTSRITFLGNRMIGKWGVHQLLAENRELAAYLPHTEPYVNTASLLRWLNRHGEAFIKPQGGCQGRGAVHMIRRSIPNEEDHYELKGRTQQNKPFHFWIHGPETLSRWTNRFISHRKYVIQQYLTLTTPAGEPFDIRSLMQKNGKGKWQLTGVAVRKGNPNSVTANLHGGGKAEDANLFLSKQFGEEAAIRTINTVRRLSQMLPPLLERRLGRLVELGIDFGVDQDGLVWILEVNSKPGRSIFSKIGNHHARKHSIRQPIDYARFLLDLQLGG